MASPSQALQPQASTGTEHKTRFSGPQWIVKRSFDVIFALIVLLFIAPTLILIAVLIKLDSPGPILYISERIGRGGRRIKFYKFRTMVRNADAMRETLIHMNERKGVLFKITNDPRVTRLGRILRKYSLDELPQFLSVLTGDMSVIGPRPCLPSEFDKFTTEQRRRFDAVPGITGLWQVEARQNPNCNTYFALDLHYVKEWNLWMDVKIFMRTFKVVVIGTGS